jgi:hypothetical protein
MSFCEGLRVVAKLDTLKAMGPSVTSPLKACVARPAVTALEIAELWGKLFARSNRLVECMHDALTTNTIVLPFSPT